MFENIKSKQNKRHRVKNKIKLNNKNVEVPDGLYIQCPICKATLNSEEVSINLHVCPSCNHHFRMSSSARIKITFDRFEEFNHHIKTKNVLDFAGYDEKINQLSEQLGINEAVVTGYATIGNTNLIGIVMDSNFLMGSMGVAVGEKITKAFEAALRLNYPVVLFCASGGARMQEGMFSLMQMAKTSGVINHFLKKKNVLINILSDPTTGGVTASFAMLGDIIIGEPNALIGFAGPRVIEQTIKETLPEGFQRSEFLLEHGFLDLVVDRRDLKDTIEKLLVMHEVV
ncbi:MAG: acetyl-CoA carboxylase, carboxyltransferase subunit beta [Bacilli bacterium]